MFPIWTLAAEGGHDAAAGYVVDLLVILLAASAVSIVARKIRLPSIPGYLLVGALVGKSMLGLIGSDENVRQISDLAIVLLMFTIGLHLDTDSIRSGMVSILVVGLASTVSVVLVAWPVGIAFGLTTPAALAVAMAVSMSSTAVVLGILQQNREVHRVHGRLCVGIALVQDMISIAVLATLGALAAWAGVKATGDAAAAGSGETLPPGLQLLASGALKLGGIGCLVWLGRWLLPKALKEASKNSNTEALLVVAAASALGAAVITYKLGFGPALGAFLAGFMLSPTPFRHQLAGQLSPMRDLFMAVFFTAVGIKMDVGAALSSWWIVALGVVAVLGIKTDVVGFSTWAGGATAAVAALTGLLLAQAGEFTLVILDEAVTKGIVSPQAQSVLIAVVVLTLVATTPLYVFGKRMQARLVRIPPARWITNPHLHEPGAGSGQGGGHGAAGVVGGDPFGDDPLPYPHRPVIIAGFGVVGRNIAEHFAAAGIPYVVIELNPKTVIKQQSMGRNFIFGDISNPDVLESAGVHAAEAVILTIPDDEAVLRACRMIRQISPTVFIAARTTYLSRAIAAAELGADHVTVEEVVTAQDMAKQVMERLAKRLVSG